MKPTILIGIALILIGIAILTFLGFSYTSREEVLKIGPIVATAETTKTVPIPSILGYVAIAGGVGSLLFGAMRKP